MKLGLLAKKIGMSRFYDAERVNQPVTILEVDNCRIADISKTDTKNVIRLAFGSKKKVSKATSGFLKKNNLTPFEGSKGFKVSSIDEYKIGDQIGVEQFSEGQYVDVSSNSIGKGFAGGMKRHNFSGNRATHGVSISHRSHGSTGQCQDPGKVFKGKKMAGRLGNKKITIQNLLVLKIDKENNLLIIKGAIPGHKGALITVNNSKKKNFVKANISKTVKDSEQKIEEPMVNNESKAKSGDVKPSEDTKVEKKDSSAETSLNENKSSDQNKE